MESTSTRVMSHEEWLQARRFGIGGSDAAAIVGLNEYSSAYEVWADKVGILPEKPDTEAMRQGRDFEDYVAARFSEATGQKVRRVNEILHSINYPWAIANIDRKLVGLDEGLECKTTSVLNLRKFQNGEYPAQYYVQCMHYMAVTGWQAMHLAVLVLNKDFLLFRIERDEEEIAALMSAEKNFWEEHVVSKVAPAPDGSDGITDIIAARYPESVAEMDVDLTLYREALQELVVAKGRVKEAEREEERLKQVIQEALQAAGRGHAEGYKVTWSTQERRTLDKEKLLEAYPALDLDPFMKMTRVRPFIIREV